MSGRGPLLPLPLAACLLVAVAQHSSAQRGARGFDPASTFELLRSEHVIRELELVGDQLAQLREVGQSIRAEFVSRMNTLASVRNLSEQQRQEQRSVLRQQMEQLAERTQRKINEILLPHQRERLAQIRLQLRLHSGSMQALETQPMREALDLSEDQIVRLRSVSERRVRQMQQEIRDLRQRTVEEILGEVLTAEQRRILARMLGRPFDLPASNRPPRFGGDRGAPDRDES